MTNLLNNLNTVLGAGIGGVAFLGAWAYMILRWLGSLGTDGALSFGSQTITIPWLW